MKHQNITLSIPADLNVLLHKRITNRGISKYVSEAILKALKEDERNEQSKLEACYEAASKDFEREKEIEEFDVLDSDIEGWEWENG